MSTYLPSRNGGRIGRATVAAIYGNLPPGSIVHHINGSEYDNRVGNLMLFAGTRDHVRWRRFIRDGAGEYPTIRLPKTRRLKPPAPKPTIVEPPLEIDEPEDEEFIEPPTRPRQTRQNYSIGKAMYEGQDADIEF